jgi:hypothetical protein
MRSDRKQTERKKEDTRDRGRKGGAEEERETLFFPWLLDTGGEV